MHPVEARRQLLRLPPPARLGLGHVQGADAHAQRPLVQHLVVLEVVQQRRGHVVGVAGQEHRRPGHAHDARARQARQERGEQRPVLSPLRQHQLAPALPGGHQRHERTAQHERHPAPFQQLERVGGEEQPVEDEEGAEHPERRPARPAELAAEHHGRQHGGAQEGARHRDAVGRRQRVAAAEREHQHEHAGQQGRVDLGHVDLALLGLAGVAHRHARQQVELHALPGDGVCPGDQRLAGDHGGQRGERHERQAQCLGGEQVERVLGRHRVAQHQRALAEVVQRQARQDEEQPRQADRPRAEVAHVGVERLGAGDGQHHRAERNKGEPAVAQAEGHGVVRRERAQHRRVARDAGRPQHTEGCEPQHHHRAEHPADAAGAAALRREQRDDHRDRGRQHEPLQPGGGHLQPFHRRKHRDRRRDHPVAEQQAGAGDPDQRQPCAGARAHGDTLGQDHQGQDAALAAVVGAHDEQDVLDRDDQHQRPEDQRQQAEDLPLGGGVAVQQVEAGLEGVERAGADVAIHHPQHPQQRAELGSRPARRHGVGNTVHGHALRVLLRWGRPGRRPGETSKASRGKAAKGTGLGRDRRRRMHERLMAGCLR